MNNLPATPKIHAILNTDKELELISEGAPFGAVIRIDINATSPRMLCTQGCYLAPIQAPPGTRIRYRLFQGKRSLTEPETFIMPGEVSPCQIPSTLIPCTQNRDFMIYDWVARHEAICQLVKKIHPEILFIGDSITHFWGGPPIDEPQRDILQKSPETWKQCTAGLRAVNLGFGYDRIENVLWRLRHGELDGAKDDAICVLLLGTNNIPVNTDEEILTGIATVCREITTKLKNAHIILQGFYPRNNPRKGSAERLSFINYRLQHMASEQGFIYTNPGRVLADASGYVPEKLSADGLHPSAAGYELIATELAPVIKMVIEQKNNI